MLKSFLPWASHNETLKAREVKMAAFFLGLLDIIQWYFVIKFTKFTKPSCIKYEI
jgi:hypothetical protein